MSLLLGVLFLVAGLALAVFLGIVLYGDPSKKRRPRGNAPTKEPETA